MTDRIRIPRIPAPLAFWVVVALALLASHDTIWLVQIGPGEPLARALRSAGHDYWAWASLAIVGGGLFSAAVAASRIVRLRRRAAALGARSSVDSARHRDRMLRVWLRLAAFVAVGFLVQENAEHFIVHAHLPGLGALAGPEYPLAIPVIAAITGVAAVMLTGITGIERALVASITASLSAVARRAPVRLARRSTGSRRPAGPALGEPGACRAPPSLLAITSI